MSHMQGLIGKIVALCIIVFMAAILTGSQADSFISTEQDSTITALPALASGLSVPALSVGTDRATLVWSKPDGYQDIVGYAIYENGQFLTDASNNSLSMSESYLQSFYSDPSNQDAEKTSTHSFVVSGLGQATTYTFSVKAINSDGSETTVGESVTVTTQSSGNTLDVASYGAVGDGVTDDTEAIQHAIDACPTNGVVLLPSAKTFLSGPLYLKADMTLEIDGTLLASSDASAYQNSGDSSKAAPLLSNEDQADENIRIVGTGTIDGNGWQEAGSDDQGFPAYEKGSDKTVDECGILAASEFDWAKTQLGYDDSKAYSWRSNIIAMQGVDGLYLGGGLTILNPAQHVISVNECSDVTLDCLEIDSYDCNNGDGIDFCNSQGLLVINSVFDTGDDSIDLNAGYGQQGEQKQTVDDVWIFDNYFAHGHAALAVGSGTAAGIEDVLAEDNVIDGEASGLRCKTSEKTGGGAHDITFRDSALKNIDEEEGEPFVITSLYPEKEDGTAANDAPIFHNIAVKRCTVDGSSGSAILVAGLSSAWHYDLLFSDISFTNTEPASLTYLKNSIFDGISSDLGESFFQTQSTAGLYIGGAI
jgi:exo-poly-alpha-galacturonosidase